MFLRDPSAGTTTRVSVAADGGDANGSSSTPSVSADGRFVAFSSTASNLVAGDGNAEPDPSPPGETLADSGRDVFVRDMSTGVTQRVSVAAGGGEGAGSSAAPSISADGTAVAFTSAAANLVPGDTNAVNDVFVRDRVAGSTTRVSVGEGGEQAMAASASPALSGDGQVVAFASTAGLTSTDTDGRADVFARDLARQTTGLVSITDTGGPITMDSYDPAVNQDGTRVLFTSAAPRLDPGDTDTAADVFVRDRVAQLTAQVSLGPQAAVGASAVSADGQVVAVAPADLSVLPAAPPPAPVGSGRLAVVQPGPLAAVSAPGDPPPVGPLTPTAAAADTAAAYNPGPLFWPAPPLNSTAGVKTVAVAQTTTATALGGCTSYLTGGGCKIVVPAGWDATVNLPQNNKRYGQVWVAGGRNIIIRGGFITVPEHTTKDQGDQKRALRITDATGIVHIEGVRMDASGDATDQQGCTQPCGSSFDAIKLGAPQATVQVENVRVIDSTISRIRTYNPDGSIKTDMPHHSDVIQAALGVGALRTDLFHLTGQVQQLSAPRRGRPHRTAALSAHQRLPLR